MSYGSSRFPVTAVTKRLFLYPVPGAGTLPVVVQRRKRWSLRQERNPPSETIPLQFYAD